MLVLSLVDVGLAFFILRFIGGLLLTEQNEDILRTVSKLNFLPLKASENRTKRYSLEPAALKAERALWALSLEFS